MWFAPIVPLFALGVYGPAESGTGAAPAAQPIATRQTVFTIPFNIPPAQPGAPQPVEVHLSVSVDGGQTWQPSGRARPDQPGFMFRAPGDGQYAFAIQTLLRNPDGSTQLRPPEPTKGLAVIVDTRPPNLALEATQGEAGQITARWQVDEPDIAPGGLTLQYRIAPNGPWQPVAVPQQPQRNPDGTQSGQVTWWTPTTSGTVEIRAELTDRAGNPAVTHARVMLQNNNVTKSTPRGAPGGSAVPPTAPTSPPANNFAATPPGTMNGTPTQTPSANNGSGGWQAGTPGPPAAEWPPYETQGHPLVGRSAGQTAAPPTSPGQPQSPQAGQAERGPAAGVNPPIGGRYGGPTATADAPLATPEADSPRMVNSRLFELEYDVDSIGPSGIAKVELFSTRNGGRNWESLALDDDNRSPLLVKVDEEGTYGFKVVITSGAGLGGQAPRPGDQPDVTIEVDLTVPTAQILSADQGVGPESGNLVITWDADDENLAARPITLLYGETAGGPWKPIASDIENTGRYVWPIRRSLPPKTYFRLEVRDEAGNVGVDETAQSVALDHSRPAGRIRNVRPLGPAAQNGPKRYYFR